MTTQDQKMKSYVFCLLFLLSSVASLSPSRRTGLRAPPAPPGLEIPKPQWITQVLDHFNKSDMRTWNQRYFVNGTFWSKESGPVFLMLGGEGEANPTWLGVNTEIMINAQKYKALVILIEHRYYGESHPTSDISNKNLKYLSSRQALADVAFLHDTIVTRFNLTDKNRWISFGGSYSGALSAWLRLLYPKVVVGAVATSAPVLASEDFYQYLEVVQASLGSSSHGMECVKSVANATSQLDDWLQNQNNWKMVEELFHISPPLESAMDVTQAAQNLAGNFMGVVQYNKDNTAFEGRPNAITIEDLCSIMVDESQGTPIQRYAAVNKLFIAGGGHVDCNYKNMIKEMSMVTWDSDVAGGARQWFYQTCTEFGYFQTTDSSQQPFGKLISLASYTDICSQVFNVTTKEIEMSIVSTNTVYGGKNITGTNIVFPNGSIDPWHQLGINTDISPTLKAFYIHGTAHCANMYPPSPHDPKELSDARMNITGVIGSWLQ